MRARRSSRPKTGVLKMICLGIGQSLATRQPSFAFFWVRHKELGSGGSLGERREGEWRLGWFWVGVGENVGVGLMGF